MSGHQTAPKADEYRSPYLQQEVAAGQADPISRWVRYYQRRAAAEAAQAIAALATLAGGKPSVCVDNLLDDIDGSLTVPAGDDCFGRTTGRQSATRRWPTSPERSVQKPVGLRPASWWPIP